MEIYFISLSAAFILTIAFITHRTKRILRKSQTSIDRIRVEVTDQFSRIEARMAKPFSDFENPLTGRDWMIIFTLNRKEMLLNTIKSMREYEKELCILVIDNGSSDGTVTELHNLLSNGTIDRIIINKPGTVPQWQKCYNLHQAFKLLSIDKVEYLGWIDDDMLIKKPFVNLSKGLLNEKKEENIGLINFVVDEIQNRNHPIIKTFDFRGEKVHIKETLVGMFVFFKSELILNAGLPPIGEGVNDLSLDDWYYSRQLKARGIKVAAVDVADHLGYKSSIREQIS